MKEKSIILLSGGLDSIVLLGVYKNKLGIDLALTFNYGQKTSSDEIEAAQNICEYYNIKHKVIILDWLKDITTTALVSDNDVPIENLGTEDSAKKVWVPNRNGLFLNIAACYADAFGYNNILFGANKDEGLTFSDNTEEFRSRASDLFKYSTQVKPAVLAPLINYTKDDIVKIAMEYDVPLEFVRSCYHTISGKHCGKCESCLHLRAALENNHAHKYINILFG